MSEAIVVNERFSFAVAAKFLNCINIVLVIWLTAVLPSFRKLHKSVVCHNSREPFHCSVPRDLFITLVARTVGQVVVGRGINPAINARFQRFMAEIDGD